MGCLLSCFFSKPSSTKQQNQHLLQKSDQQSEKKSLEKQDLNFNTKFDDLTKNKQRQEHISIFQDQVYCGSKPSSAFQNQCLFQLPPNVYKSKITLQDCDGNEGQELFKNITDNRKRISNTTSYPYRSIGLLSMKFGNSWATGSGALIAGKYILTCAHNVYDRQSKKYAKEIIFFPSCNGKKTNSPGYQVTNKFVTNKYKFCNQQQKFTFDFAILQIKENISKQFGYFGIDFSGSDYKNQEVIICGYPGDKLGNEEKTMWQARGTIEQKDTDKRQLYYEIPTYPGQSGSPIFIKKGQNYFIIGVHTHSSGIKQMNSGWCIQNFLKCNFQIWMTCITGILSLRNNKIGDIGCKQLVYNNWDQLKKLQLRNNDIGSQGCKYLQNWPELKVLNLNYNYIGAQGCKYLVQQNWPALQEFYLKNNYIGNKGCKHLAQQAWPRLKKICLQNNNIGAQGCKYLTSKNWPRLKQLYLNDNNVNDDGCQNLTNKRWSQLTILALANNSISSKGYIYLASQIWQKLSKLQLTSNSINTNGLKFSSYQNWPKLKVLHLGNNGIDDEGIRQLAYQINQLDLKLKIVW